MQQSRGRNHAELTEKTSRSLGFMCPACVGCRSETGWDLGLGTLCCSAGARTHLSWSNKTQRNHKGLKTTVCMCTWGKLWTTRYKKTKNPTATSEEPGAKAGPANAPCTQHHLRGGRTTSASPPARPLHAPLPSPRVRKQLAPPRGVSQGPCCLTSLPTPAAGPQLSLASISCLASSQFPSFFLFFCLIGV